MKKKLATKISATSLNKGANGGGSGKVGVNTQLPKVTKPRLRFIDRLENELKAAGIRVKRGGWNDYSFDSKGKRSESADDNCEWVTIITKTKDKKKKYEIEFYFSNDSKTLDTVHVYVKKKKKGYGGGNLLSVSDYKEVFNSDQNAQASVASKET